MVVLELLPNFGKFHNSVLESSTAGGGGGSVTAAVLATSGRQDDRRGKVKKAPTSGGQLAYLD